MVTMGWPATALTGTTQLRVALPFNNTVQAPHRPSPHPNFVPVSARSSRNTHSSGVSASTSTLRSDPLTLTVNMSGSQRLVGERIPGERQRAHAGTRGRIDSVRESGGNRPGAGLTHATGCGG